MATITQTVQEYVIKNELRRPLEKQPKQVTFAKYTSCPADCPCKKNNDSRTSLQVMFKAIGIILAVLATYLIVSTDSQLYLVFWIGYSILRRMMKTKKSEKSEKTE